MHRNKQGLKNTSRFLFFPPFLPSGNGMECPLGMFLWEQTQGLWYQRPLTIHFPQIQEGLRHGKWPSVLTHECTIAEQTICTPIFIWHSWWTTKGLKGPLVPFLSQGNPPCSSCSSLVVFNFLPLSIQRDHRLVELEGSLPTPFGDGPTTSLYK